MRVILILIFLAVLKTSYNQQVISPHCQPWGVRTSFGEFYTKTDEVNQLYIAFNSDNLCSDMSVWINSHSYNCTVNPLHIDIAALIVNYNTYVYRCAVYGIQFNDTQILSLPYSLRAGLKPLTTPQKQYQLRLVSKFIKSSFRALVIGDWGLLDQPSKQIYYDVFPCLNNAITDQQIVMTLFMGDLGYELTDNNCQKYKQTLQALEPFTSIMPFMITPGNHDTHNSTYQLFTQTFFSPYWQTNFNYFYALYIGSVEIVSYNPQKYVYEAFTDIYPNGYPLNNNVDVKGLIKQHYKQQYSLSSSIKTRLAVSHYSMYCSNPFDLQCAANGDAEHLRYFHKVFQRHNVTMSLGAHIHLYERSYPLELEGELTHFKNLSTSLSHSIYENPDGITFISEGAGGNDYFVNRVPYPIKEFTATTIQNTGYGIIELQSGLNITYRHFTALNCTEVDFVQIFISTKNLLGVQTNTQIIAIAVGGGLLLIVIIVIGIYVIKRRKLLKLMKGPQQNQMELQEQKFEEEI